MLPFRNLVLGGGGARCFWQAGVLRVLRRAGLEPRRIASVSGGALVAASFVSGNGDALRHHMRDEFKDLKHNVRRRHLSHGRLFPHLQAYTRAIERAFDQAAIAELKQGPAVFAQITRAPRRLSRAASLVADIVHEVERRIRQTPHGRWVTRLGFTAEQVDVTQVRNGSELARLLAAAGCIPPIVPLRYWGGRAALDGALLDNAPVAPVRLAESVGQPTLVLTTRRYSRLPQVASRTYLMPSRELAANKLDFTDARAIDRAYYLGGRDGEAFLERCPPLQREAA